MRAVGEIPGAGPVASAKENGESAKRPVAEVPRPSLGSREILAVPIAFPELLRTAKRGAPWVIPVEVVG